MSVWDDMAKDAGYRGDEARQVARMLEEEERRKAEERNPCPMGCGRYTEDPYGGPCEACWELTAWPRAVSGRRAVSERKTPILLRKGPMSGRIQAIYRYTMKRGMVCATGKQDVTADFDVLLLEELIPDPTSSIVAELDGAARGIALNEQERAVVGDFRERLIAVIERHNARLSGEREHDRRTDG